MSEGARVDPADNWLVGEDKELIFTVRNPAGVVVDATGWTCRYAMFRSQAVVGDLALLTVNVVGAGGVITVAVPAAATAGLRGGTYEHVLRRLDPGAAAVLAYDSVTLGEAP